MTSVVRYVQHTMDGGTNTPSVSSTGFDHQHVKFDITTTVGIAAGDNADILVWTGAGKIKSCDLLGAKIIATGELLPVGAVAQNTHSLLTVDAAGKTINLSVPAAGVAIPANSLISLLLVIGNYS